MQPKYNFPHSHQVKEEQNNKSESKIDKLLSQIKENWVDNFNESLFRKGISFLCQKINENFPGFDMKGEELFKENHFSLVNFIFKFDERSYPEIYRVLSCIYGAFFGDATGAYCEFEESNKNNYSKAFNGNPMFGEKPGQVTDDSEMAMSLAFGLMDMPKKSELNSNYPYFYYGCWYKSDPNDIGNATRSALSYFKFNSFHPKNDDFKNIKKGIESSNKGSLANGFLMRISPFIVWTYYRFNDLVKKAFTPNNQGKYNTNYLNQLYKKIRTQAENDNVCTHPNPETFSASACFTMLGLGTILGINGNNLLHIMFFLFQSPEFTKEKTEEDGFVANNLMDYTKKFCINNFDAWDYFTVKEPVTDKMGWYMHAFKLTIYYLLHFKDYGINNISPYLHIMFEICNFGGDTDTNAAIVGAVIGPLFGYKNFANEFGLMINLSPKGREFYTPSLMVLYVDYLIKTNNGPEDINEEYNYIKMMLRMLYTQIDTTKLFR